MKLKKLVGSMMVLGLVTTAVIAGPKTSQDSKAATVAGTDDKATKQENFWATIVDRNEDGAYSQDLTSGQIMLSASLAPKANVSLNQRAKADNNNNKDDFSISPEIYLNARLNEYSTVHLALSYDDNNTFNNLNGGNFYGADVEDKNNVAKDVESKKELYIPEAYLKLNHEQIFAKVGQQYINFGSTSHGSISTPLTQQLSQTNQLAVTVGAQNLKGTGLYADISGYKGARVTSGDQKTIGERFGYTAELGYAKDAANYNLNIYTDFINDMADVDSVNYAIASGRKAYVSENTTDNGGAKSYLAIKPAAAYKAIPGMAAHVGFTMGKFQVMADYVTAMKKFDQGDNMYYKGQFVNDVDYGAKPQAYGMEVDYNFMPKQTVTLGYQETKQALSFGLPKQRTLVAYTYQFSDHVSVSSEIKWDKDYSSNEFGLGYDDEAGRISGSGKTKSTALAKLSVIF